MVYSLYLYLETAGANPEFSFAHVILGAIYNFVVVESNNCDSLRLIE
jgi:hypothetical protein